MRKTILAIIIVVVSVFLVSWIMVSNKELNMKSGSNIMGEQLVEANHNVGTSLLMQSDSRGKVTVEVTPKQIGFDKGKNFFTVNLNTHSVPLNFDFKQIITMLDDSGEIYSALEWTGNQGGHHVSGEIVFPRFNKQSKTVIIKINGIVGSERIFKWDL